MAKPYEEWAEVAISEIADGIYDGPHATPKLTVSGPIFLGISSLVGGRLDLTQSGCLSEEDFIRWTRRVTPEQGDLVFSYETRLGEAALIPAGVRCCLGRRLALVRPKRSVVLPEYLLYAYLSPRFQEQIRQYTVQGSTVDRIALTQFPSFRILLPSLREQHAIVGILGALDAKIESNLRLSRVATDFCDQRFLSASDIDAQISDIADVTMGSSPPGDTYNTEGVGMPFYQGVTDFGFLSPTRRVWTTSPIREAKVGDVLVSVRAPVGRLNEANEKCCIGRGVAAISSDFQSTLFYALRQAGKVWAPFEGEGTVFGSINKGDLERARISWVSPDRICGLDSELTEVHQRLRASMSELVSLRSLRDMLLPELLSGRLRVKEAETMMENAK